jgi:DNA-directed RNA polymerase specialized sigma24 family protein
VRRVGQDDAEDLVQDALLRAVAIKSRPRSSWRTWLFAIIKYSYLERAARWPALVELTENVVATDTRGRVVALQEVAFTTPRAPTRTTTHQNAPPLWSVLGSKPLHP